MSATNRFDSPVAQFADNPFTRNWPEPAAVEALFRYCVKRFMDQCRLDPRMWLTETDLCSLLAEILRSELPSHGLPSYAVHLDYPTAPQAKTDLKSSRNNTNMLDLVLLVPGTIHCDAASRYDATLALGAFIKLGFEPLAALREDLTHLAAIQARFPNALFYLVVIGYQNNQEAIDTATCAAQELGLTLISENYTGLEEPIRQERLL